MVRILGKGVLTGLAATGAIALIDYLMDGGYLFGLLTGLIGIATGGITLLLAFLMAVTGYLMASRNSAPALRQRLVLGAVWAGAAGMTCGFASAMIWLAVGHPWFP